MLKQIVKNYATVGALNSYPDRFAQGGSVARKDMVLHILPENSGMVEVLDIGFGSGGLAEFIKNNPQSLHWAVDGVDGWDVNCHNASLIQKRYYRNIWHGLAQEISSEQLSRYKIICLLDVIEHLTADSAKWLLRTLLSSLGQDAYLMVSTPLWFYPQDQLQAGDLEEHLIGVPASSMMALAPLMYTISNPLVGTFVLNRSSLDLIEFFQPTADKSFNFERGLRVFNAVRMHYEPGRVFKF